MSAVPDLAQLRGVTTATELSAARRPRPVDPVLAPLFRRGGLARGEIVELRGAHTLTLGLAALAAASHEGHWCAGIGLGELAVQTLADLGIDLDYFVNLATPAQDWLRVTSILVESFDVLIVLPGFHPTAGDRARLQAKVRERKLSLIMCEPFAGSSESITVTNACWAGTDQGHGRLQTCTVTARNPHTGTHRFLLPDPNGKAAVLPADLPTPGTSAPAASSPAAFPAPGTFPAPAASSPADPHLQAVDDVS